MINSVLLKDKLFVKVLLKFSTREAEEVFGKGKYNNELYQFAINKVFKKEREKHSLEDTLSKYTNNTGVLFQIMNYI